jgi:hypothetical protein
MKAGAERSQHLGHVSDQVVIDLVLVGEKHPPTSRLKGRFEVSCPEAGETVAVLETTVSAVRSGAPGLAFGALGSWPSRPR